MIPNSSRDIESLAQESDLISHALHRSIHLHSTELLPSQSRSVHMFDKTFFPISLRRADVAEVAFFASVFVNDTRKERFRDSVFELEP